MITPAEAREWIHRHCLVAIEKAKDPECDPMTTAAAMLQNMAVIEAELTEFLVHDVTKGNR